MKSVSKFATFGMAALLLASCSSLRPNGIFSPVSGDGFTKAGDVGGVAEVSTGTVMSVEAHKITPNSHTAGMAVGGLAGALAGSTIGGGRTTNMLAAAGTGIAGAAVGAYAQNKIMTDDGVILKVKLDNSRRIVRIMQKGKVSQFYAGQRVEVEMGSSASRVIPLN